MENTSLRERFKIYQIRDEEMDLCDYKMKIYEKEKNALLEQIEDIRASCNRQKEEELESLKVHLA